VGIVAGLVNQPWRRPRGLTTVFLLRRMHAVLYGKGELAPLLQRAPTLGPRVHVNAFGVDTAFWAPAPEPAAREVLAIGNDGHRDWETLVMAAADIPARVRVFTRHPKPAGLPANVSWAEADWHRQLLSDADVRELYRNAAAVVVPVKNVPQPSGQSVTLQAMACGRPVVLSRTRGLWRPETLHDGVNVQLVPPSDAAALAAAVRDLLDDPARAHQVGAEAREGVLRDASVHGYAARLERICDLAVERP
jgi:glycosyltransferase involved in cell wall biosynthesis